MFPFLLLPLVALVLPFLYVLATCFRLPRYSFPSWDTYKGAVLGHRGCRMDKLLEKKQKKKSLPTRPKFGYDDDDDDMDDTPAYDIPENSMSAFRYAAVNGATGVECDVMLTRDNVIVVMHDDLVSRVMNSNKRISEMTYTEVSQLKYKPIPGTQSYPYADIDYDQEGQPQSLMTGVPTLEHLIQFCLSHHLKLMIELKEVARPTLIRSIIATYFDQYNLFDVAFVATFHPIHLYRMRQERPDIPTCLLYCRDCLQWYHEEGSREMQLPRIINTRMLRWIVDQTLEYGSPWLGQIMGATMLGPDRALVSPQFIADLATRGIHVYTWVVNDDADVHALASLGVTVGTDFCFKQKHNKLAIHVTKINQSKIAYSTPVVNELISPSANPMCAS